MFDQRRTKPRTDEPLSPTAKKAQIYTTKNIAFSHVATASGIVATWLNDLCM
jgi:hypothetical protein